MKKAIKFFSLLCTIITVFFQGAQNLKSSQQIVISLKKRENNIYFQSRLQKFVYQFKDVCEFKITLPIKDYPQLFLEFLTHHPQATQYDIKFALEEIRQYDKNFIISYRIYEKHIYRNGRTPDPDKPNESYPYCFDSITNPKTQYIFQTILHDKLLKIQK